MIFSATVPQYIQDLAVKKQKNPILLDLVGTDTNQVPDTIKNYGVIVESLAQKHAILKEIITSNPDKKIMVFTETKSDSKELGLLPYAEFLPLHGDLAQNERSRIM